MRAIDALSRWYDTGLAVFVYLHSGAAWFIGREILFGFRGGKCAIFRSA